MQLHVPCFWKHYIIFVVWVVNHCITCTALTPSLCAHNPERIFQFWECTMWMFQPTIDLDSLLRATGRIKMLLLILPVLHKFYWQSKQSVTYFFLLLLFTTNFPAEQWFWTFPVVLNMGPLDWESNTLTTRPLLLIYIASL